MAPQPATVTAELLRVSPLTSHPPLPLASFLCLLLTFAKPPAPIRQQLEYLWVETAISSSVKDLI